MTNTRNVEARISAWLEEREAGTHYPDRLLTAAFDETRMLRQARPSRWPAFPTMRSLPSVAAAGIAAALVVSIGVFGLRFIVNAPGTAGSPTPRASASHVPGPSTTLLPTSIVVPPHDGVLLDWSSDGSRFLIQKDEENLFVLNVDGSETQVTDQLTGITRFLGSARPAGAAISPDGTRVVFAGLTKPVDKARSCHDGGIFAVGASGGTAALLFSSRIPQNGIVRYPTFSPDGTQIAFVDGYCDSDHHVWVMHADGTGAREIVLGEDPASGGDAYGFNLGGAHVYGLAWSVDGERIAVQLDDAVLNFRRDGTDVTRGLGGTVFCWAGLREPGC
jgi:Tol biopolymer transport system component